MNFSYWDMLSGSPIYVDGIGHFRSPFLKELKPGNVGINLYNTYITILSWGKEDFFEHLSTNRAIIFNKNPQINLFDMMTKLQPGFIGILRDVLGFFLTEKVAWDSSQDCFITARESRDGEIPDLEHEGMRFTYIGKINRDNFEDVKDMVLQINYMSLGKEGEPKYTSPRAKHLWELAQSKMKETGKKSGVNKWLRLENMISKLCAAQGNYNLNNIYELTVYQLIDQFFQYNYLRGCAINENAYATNGGDKFDFQQWLKPVPQLQDNK